MGMKSIKCSSRRKRCKETKAQKDYREFWEFVEKTAKEVESWPAWKRVIFPEDYPDIQPVLPRKK